jgi:hypothetical protein
MFRILPVATLLALSLLVAPAHADRTCVGGDNPNALLNVCKESGNNAPSVATQGGICVIGNICPRAGFFGASDFCVAVEGTLPPVQVHQCLVAVTL